MKETLTAMLALSPEELLVLLSPKGRIAWHVGCSQTPPELLKRFPLVSVF